MSTHTILLVQENDDITTRVWEQCENLEAAIRKVIEWYEDLLKTLNPGMKHIKYSAVDLLRYMDGLNELVCLSLDSKTNAYVPRSRDYIKQKVQQFLVKL